MEEIRPWCDQPSDRGRLKTMSENFNTNWCRTIQTLCVHQMDLTWRECSSNRD